TARSVRRSCSTAAACAPIAGIRRVLASPGVGAFARIAMETGLLLGGGIAIFSRKLRWGGGGEGGQPPPPHQEYRAQCSLFLPATGRGCSACVEAKRTADTLEMHGQREVFHQCDWREAPCGIESGTSDEQGLIASSDPG